MKRIAATLAVAAAIAGVAPTSALAASGGGGVLCSGSALGQLLVPFCE